MKKAFVLVDYQNDFIDGSLGFQKAKLIKENILEKLSSLDFQTTHLFITFDTHDERYFESREGKHLYTLHCQKNTQGWQMPNEFEPFLQKATKIFYKNTFGSLELANFLQDFEYEEIEFCGLISHICVFHTLILAFNALPKTKFILHKNLTTSFDESLQNSAFALLASYGVELL
ncbi:cysteine hydrolase family protein [Campylobacter sp. MIT 21-1685]|uniref:cysteine hydrolase family protein n=1 Tax=unclassified Campylobacter TaxID=2593542 RepID=UPI00224BA134|nr:MULTISPECIES: cysteine hydrolase family protein [unclassified Campylobacter]MCX2683321.1 cysteine hydrolase family protein [Campylobacter sp. MIT 21-1684]MCX2751624.1 cysteine hydrolase family protein [Campylobacter sp. MIT 21-1682]MCX2807823.1 cysteine hydrolase family protein [Campylobacter sp. MIT 21-1685]